MRSSAAAVAACVLCFSACAAERPAPPGGILATSLQELVPHNDRDHFVYAFVRTLDGRFFGDGIQVEHVSALQSPGEFEVTLSENGIASGRVHIRDTGSAIMLLSEDDLSRGIRLTYDPPLPYLEAPVVSGEQHAESTASITRLTDGEPAGSLQVAQMVRASAAPPGRTILGRYTGGVAIHTVRTLQSPDGQIDLSTTLVLVSGLGEVQSDGIVPGAPALHRELACATLDGRRIGDCRDLNARVKELRSAGSTNVQ